ncbi:glycosyltransferase family 8 protein [Sulfitobacter sp. SK012]|uniref:glycosyltransferase family 8 protein n=1 Tax=Sulfitobacter sp. SK012 TaxID=1389005 RepID=UPI0013B3F2D8|nr:glycosyltransferase [Sulfitobacter sp. SK012]
MDRYLQRRYKYRAPTRLDVMTSYAGQNLDVVQVLLLSLSETHPRDEIVFWLFEQRVSAQDIAALADFCASLGNVTLRSIKIPHTGDFDRLKTLGGKRDSARFLWFVAHQHLPRDLKRVVYLDALDVIVSDDLVPLLKHPFLGKYLVACREWLDIPPLLVGPARRAHDCGVPTWMIKHMSRGLINSGAIVLNLDKFRRDGIEIGHYVETAEWAYDKLNLEFGDQGLFSLTHGSHYVQANDRYNHRFFNDLPNRTMKRPAVIHYCGGVLKPVHWRLTAEAEHLVAEHLVRKDMAALTLANSRQLRAADLPYMRKWWDVCVRTPCYSRIAPQASQRMAAALSRVGLNVE